MLRSAFVFFVALAAVAGAAPALGSITIEPINSGLRWTGKARVTFWQDNREGVVVDYPVSNGCPEASDFMIAAKAGSTSFGSRFRFQTTAKGVQGRFEQMGAGEINALLHELTNDPPADSGITEHPEINWKGITQVPPYPSEAFECRGSGLRFPNWEWERKWE